PICSTSALSTLVVTLESKEAVAVLLTVRSLPTQTLTLWLEDCPVSTIVAVLSNDLQVPGVPVTVRGYVNSFEANGVESVAVSVPSGPPAVSVTLTVLLTVVVGVVNAKSAEPLAQPSGVQKAPASHVAGAWCVPLREGGAKADVRS